MTTESNSLVLVTGLSGAGKSTALRALEDLGFYCVDNLPVTLLPDFASQVEQQPEIYSRVALGIDARSASPRLQEVVSWLDAQEKRGVLCQLLFVSADRKSLIKRFSETRRRHPLTNADDSLPQALAREEEMLAPLRERADWVIETSETNIHQLRRQVRKCIDGNQSPMKIVLESFAFKQGVPQDVDFLFDARNLPNPHWEASLRELTGKDEAVRKWLHSDETVSRMASDIFAFLNHWLPGFRDSERSYVTVGIGCTGGRHRSVFLVEWLAGKLRKDFDDILIHHRELQS